MRRQQCFVGLSFAFALHTHLKTISVHLGKGKLERAPVQQSIKISSGKHIYMWALLLTIQQAGPSGRQTVCHYKSDIRALMWW